MRSSQRPPNDTLYVLPHQCSAELVRILEILGCKMVHEAMLPGTVLKHDPYKELAFSVFKNAIDDARTSDNHIIRHRARTWLTSNSYGFNYWFSILDLKHYSFAIRRHLNEEFKHEAYQPRRRKPMSYVRSPFNRGLVPVLQGQH